MVVDVLPDWLMQSTLSVEGLHTSVSSQINIKEKLVSFKISFSGWLSTATCPAAQAIKESITNRAQQIKLQKEDSARKSGWIVVEGDLEKYKRDDIGAKNSDDQKAIPLAG